MGYVMHTRWHLPMTPTGARPEAEPYEVVFCFFTLYRHKTILRPLPQSATPCENRLGGWDWVKGLLPHVQCTRYCGECIPSEPIHFLNECFHHGATLRPWIYHGDLYTLLYINLLFFNNTWNNRLSNWRLLNPKCKLKPRTCTEQNLIYWRQTGSQLHQML